MLILVILVLRMMVKALMEKMLGIEKDQISIVNVYQTIVLSKENVFLNVMMDGSI